jgi:hypothetical protein
MSIIPRFIEGLGCRQFVQVLFEFYQFLGVGTSSFMSKSRREPLIANRRDFKVSPFSPRLLRVRIKWNRVMEG